MNDARYLPACELSPMERYSENLLIAIKKAPPTPMIEANIPTINPNMIGTMALS